MWRIWCSFSTETAFKGYWIIEADFKIEKINHIIYLSILFIHAQIISDQLIYLFGSIVDCSVKPYSL